MADRLLSDTGFDAVIFLNDIRGRCVKGVGYADVEVGGGGGGCGQRGLDAATLLQTTIQTRCPLLFVSPIHEDPDT